MKDHYIKAALRNEIIHAQGCFMYKDMKLLFYETSDYNGTDPVIFLPLSVRL